MNPASKPSRNQNFGTAWWLLGVAFGLHIWDEVAHHFLRYYNATVLALYGHFSGFPRIDVEWRTWLVVLVVGNLGFLVSTPWAFRNALRLRPIG